MECRDFGKRTLRRIKNYEKGQYSYFHSYFQLLTIKNVFQHYIYFITYYIFSSLHQCIYMTHCLYIFYYICTEMQLKSEDQ